MCMMGCFTFFCVATLFGKLANSKDKLARVHGGPTYNSGSNWNEVELRIVRICPGSMPLFPPPHDQPNCRSLDALIFSSSWLFAPTGFSGSLATRGRSARFTFGTCPYCAMVLEPCKTRPWPRAAVSGARDLNPVCVGLPSPAGFSPFLRMLYLGTLCGSSCSEPTASIIQIKLVLLQLSRPSGLVKILKQRMPGRFYKLIMGSKQIRPFCSLCIMIFSFAFGSSVSFGDLLCSGPCCPQLGLRKAIVVSASSAFASCLSFSRKHAKQNRANDREVLKDEVTPLRMQCSSRRCSLSELEWE
jgi:hypothetical protein